MAEKDLRHGQARRGQRSRTWQAWASMHNRCTPGWSARQDYYDRGIRVCDRWDTFEIFLEDMGECPPGLSLDRIDNDKGYEPGNCRWATRSEQNKNVRDHWTGEKNPMWGKEHSAKSKAKMRKAKLGKYNGENNPMHGRNQTEETRLLQSQAASGRAWMYHPMEGCRRVKLEEVKAMEKDGWVRGRSFNVL